MDDNRGRLTIFTSYTPGAGKSYRMVEEAVKEKNRGRTVIVGFLNGSHRSMEELAEKNDRRENTVSNDRQENENFENRLICLPNKRRYSVKRLLREQPNLVLLDEMGMYGRNLDAKTFVYEDAEVLLEEGIDVYTTANLKRFESANAAFRKVTGIGIKKKIPDRFLEMADAIYFIDREPERLVEDFSSGSLFDEKYTQSKIMQKNFRLETLEAYRKISKNYLEPYKDKVRTIVR